MVNSVDEPLHNLYEYERMQDRKSSEGDYDFKLYKSHSISKFEHTNCI